MPFIVNVGVGKSAWDSALEFDGERIIAWDPAGTWCAIFKLVFDSAHQLAERVVAAHERDELLALPLRKAVCYRRAPFLWAIDDERCTVWSRTCWVVLDDLGETLRLPDGKLAKADIVAVQSFDDDKDKHECGVEVELTSGGYRHLMVASESSDLGMWAEDLARSLAARWQRPYRHVVPSSYKAHRDPPTLEAVVDEVADQVLARIAAGESLEAPLPEIDRGTSLTLQLREDADGHTLTVHAASNAGTATRVIKLGTRGELERFLRSAANRVALRAAMEIVTTSARPSLPPPTEDEIRAGKRGAPAGDWRAEIAMHVAEVRALVNACGRPVLAHTLSAAERDEARRERRALSVASWTREGDIRGAAFMVLDPATSAGREVGIVFATPIPPELRGGSYEDWTEADIYDAFGLTAPEGNDE